MYQVRRMVLYIGAAKGGVGEGCPLPLSKKILKSVREMPPFPEFQNCSGVYF